MVAGQLLLAVEPAIEMEVGDGAVDQAAGVLHMLNGSLAPAQRSAIVFLIAQVAERGIQRVFGAPQPVFGLPLNVNRGLVIGIAAIGDGGASGFTDGFVDFVNGIALFVHYVSEIA